MPRDPLFIPRFTTKEPLLPPSLIPHRHATHNYSPPCNPLYLPWLSTSTQGCWISTTCLTYQPDREAKVVFCLKDAEVKLSGNKYEGIATVKIVECSPCNSE